MAQPGSNPKKTPGSMQALVKVEKLTQIAFALPVSALVGWGLGVALDYWLHQHWIYLVGLILGVVAGCVQIFRMVAAPGMLGATAPDPGAPEGPGFNDREDEK
jgi:F0F1-type ATP synthase assembly protein I